ncbi:sensor histidine kinase [Pseudomonas fluorescens]|uniref:sensor histidine kinase n=1 Tax=Pseudomonas fluorescens TaxID=294 RepID=UPI0012427A56|nr:ATP-binding protein [Pseudomonas fluorescens]
MQIELLFSLMNRVDPLDAVQTFVDAISVLIPSGELELEFIDQTLEPDDTAMCITLSGNGVLSLVAKGASLANDRPWLVEIAQFIDKALGAAQEVPAASAAVTSTPASMIARDLHDGVAQELAYLSLQMGLLLRKIRQPEKARPLAEELRTGLSRLQRRVRELISHARLSLSGKSLRQSLSELVHELSPRSDIVFNLDNRLPDGLLSAEVELQIMHIVREALVNAIRHSRAKTVSVELRADSPSYVLIKVEDDGVGLPSSLQGSGHYGITIMKERAASIGAELGIAVRAEGGTRLRLFFPIITHAEEASY